MGEKSPLLLPKKGSNATSAGRIWLLAFWIEQVLGGAEGLDV